MIRLAIICFLISMIESKECNYDITKINELKQNYIDSERLMNEATRGQKENAAIVLGASRSSRSALINYLLGNELEAYRPNRYSRFQLRVNDETTKGPQINMGSVSRTTIPTKWNSRRPELQNLDIWYTAGFMDNRDIEKDLSNSFHLYHLTKNVENLKFILVINFEDIETDNYEPFLRLLEIIEKYFNGTFKNKFSSISVIISNAPRMIGHGEVNNEYINMRLNKYLSNPDLLMSKDSRDFLLHVIANNQRVAFYRRAEKLGKVTSDIDDNIIPAINSCESISKPSHQDVGFAISRYAEICLQMSNDNLMSYKKAANFAPHVNKWYEDESNALQQINDTNLLNNNLANLRNNYNLISSSMNNSDILVRIQNLRMIPNIFTEVNGETNLVNEIKALQFLDHLVQSKKIERINIMLDSVNKILLDRLTILISSYSLKLHSEGASKNN